MIKTPKSGQLISVQPSSGSIWSPHHLTSEQSLLVPEEWSYSYSVTILTGAEQVSMWKHNFKGKLRASSSLFPEYFYSLTTITFP